MDLSSVLDLQLSSESAPASQQSQPGAAPAPAPPFLKPPARPRLGPGRPPADGGNGGGGGAGPGAGAGAQGAGGGQGEGEQVTLLWGTAVDVQHARASFAAFLRQWPGPAPGGAPKYLGLLRQMQATHSYDLTLNCRELHAHDAALYKWLVTYPQEVLSIFNAAAQDLYRLECDPGPGPDAGVDPQQPQPQQAVSIRPMALLRVTPVRGMDPAALEQLVALQGLVIRLSPLLPDLKSAAFQCAVCLHQLQVGISRGRIDEPTACPHCQARYSMRLCHNLCTFTDKQLVRLQETPESVPEGETPQTLTLVLYEGLADRCKPGDRVEVTGVYRAAPLRLNPRHRTVQAVYRTYVDVIHIAAVRHARHRRTATDPPPAPADSAASSSAAPAPFARDRDEEEEDEEGNVPPERAAEFARLAAQPDVYARLTRALAPSIWELDDVKKGLLCLLFGGARKAYGEAGLGRFRAEINVLLVGDPGTSKSQLLQYVNKLAPRGIYTSGKGSSAVGLTAYVTKDPDTRQAVLESGALVLSDRGVCCIDEFDKMNDQTRSILHEAMEQQTVSVAKAGIICTLNARCSILASANPRESRYNAALSVVDNIQLPPTLLSRFDLIYLVLDRPNEQADRRLARHLVSLYYAEVPRAYDDVLPVDLLTDYIRYARRHANPRLSQEAEDELLASYVQMRKQGAHRKTVTATPRQLESLIRLAEALARMRLAPEVLRADVAEAVRLMRVAMQRAATDPRTGLIDMDLLTTGRSAAARTRLAALANELRRLVTYEPVRLDAVHAQLAAQASVEVSLQEVREAAAQLAEEDVLIVSGDPRNLVLRRR